MVEEQVLTHTQEVAEQDLQVEVITDLDRFIGIAEEWDHLVDRSGMERLFVSHAWLRTWWEAFGGQRQLYIVLVRHDAELIGAIPMMHSSDRL